MTLSQKIRCERRGKSLKACAEFLVSGFGLAIASAIVYYAVWSVCGLSEVCFNVNV
jgi:hypothetical protein